MATYLDTHAAVFLADGRVDLFGPGARERLETDDLRISPLVRLEMTYLKEKLRIAETPDYYVGRLATIGVTISNEPLNEVVRVAETLSWTRDPFDRLLTAAAMLRDAPFITRDDRISANYRHAVW